jgi:uncharacterized protein YdeI (BOF family)
MTKRCITALAAVSGLALATASAQSPYLTDEGDYLTLSGTVNTVDDDSFTIDYGMDVIEVEFDEAGLFEEPAESLYPGDEVTVYGTVDDEFFEGRVINAESVYVRGDSTVYGGDEATTALFFIDPYPGTMADGTFVSLDGEVTRVRNREFMLDAGGTMISVDTMELGYNPLDDEGRQRIQEGDRVTVAGYLDDTLFDETELSARAVYKTDTGTSMQSRSSRMDRSDREDRRSNRSNSDRYSERDDSEDRSNRRASRDRSERDVERMFTTSEFAALDRNDDGVVTVREYVRSTSDMDNITRSEARELFAAISGDDDELTRREFLNPNPDAEDLFEEVLLREDG